MGIAALVLGIIALIFGLFMPWMGWLGAIMGLIGIVLGAAGRKQPENQGIATAGLVCSIVGFVLCIILYIACAACVSGLNSVIR